MCGRGLLDYGSKGDDEGLITAAFIADALAELGAKLFGREAEWGVAPDALDGARDYRLRTDGGVTVPVVDLGAPQGAVTLIVDDCGRGSGRCRACSTSRSSDR